MIKSNRPKIYSKYEINYIVFLYTMVLFVPLTLVFTYVFNIEYTFDLNILLLALLAIDVFIYKVKKYIGSYIAAMNGADAIILTAGIGENVSVVEKSLRKELSNVMGEKMKLLTIHTEEERLIAMDTLELIRKKK